MRRQLYGLVLVSASLSAQAADDSWPNRMAPVPHRIPLAHAPDAPWSDNDVLLAPAPDAQSRQWIAFGGMSALNAHARSISLDFAYVPIGELLFTAHFLGDDIDMLRKGLGVDLAVPEIGYFHLNLYSGRDGPNRGKRWQVNPSGMTLPQSQDRLWSLGGSLDLARPDRNSARQVMFIPQLILNVDQLAKVPGRMQMAMTYSRWNSPISGLLPESGMTPQISFKWAY